MIKSLPRKNLRQIWTRLRFPWAWNLMDLRVSWKLKYENGSSTLSSTVWSTILLLGNNVSTWVALKWNAFTESKRRNCCRPSSWLHQSMGKPSYGGNLQSHLITKQLRQLGFIEHLWQNLKGFLNNVFQQERVQIPASCLHFCKYGLPRLFPFAVLSSSSLHSLIPWRLSSDWSPLPSSMFLYFWSAGAPSLPLKEIAFISIVYSNHWNFVMPHDEHCFWFLNDFIWDPVIIVLKEALQKAIKECIDFMISVFVPSKEETLSMFSFTSHMI